MERCSSPNSDSSIDPMETSSSNKTGASDAYSSMLIKSNESDAADSDENDTECHNVIKRKNINQLMKNILKNFSSGSNANHQINNNNDDRTTSGINSIRKMSSTDSSTATSPQEIESSTSQNLNLSGNNNNNNNNTNSGDNMKYVCPICEVISTTPHEFSVHIRGHNNDSSDDNQSFTCRICSKVLSSASSLDRHVLVHTGERPFKCKYCSLTFTTNGNMHRHIRTHNKNDRENYESDGSTDSSNSFASAESNSITNNNNNNYAKSSDSFGEKRKSTDDDLNNKRKIRTINNNNNIITSKLLEKKHFSCPICPRNDFTSMLSLENHMDQEHPGIPTKCRHCEIVFKNHKALNAHRCGNIGKNPTTEDCRDLTFVDFSSDKFPLIARSVIGHHHHNNNGARLLECPKCMKPFTSTSAMQIHSRECTAVELPIQNLSVPSAVAATQQRQRCSSETSDEELSRRDDFFATLNLQNNSHAMSVSSNAGTSEMMSTPSTDKSFSSPFNLKDRLISPIYPSHDTKDLADIQSIINVTSSSGGFWKQLDRATADKDLDSSKCSVGSAGCGGVEEEEAQDAFTAEFRKMKLRGEFPCRLCTSVFPNLRALKGHNRIHLSAAGPGPYRCNMCPYVTGDKAALIRHMRTHNGDRPYECAICNYAFTTKANCERHLRNRHGKNTRDEIKRAIIYHPSEDSSCDDPIKKMAMFTSPETKRDERDSSRSSTPVSHLRSSLTFDVAPKIQVRSLDKLIEPKMDHKPAETHDTKPVDLSMDVLDLSKKTKAVAKKETEDDDIVEEKSGESDANNLFDKNQQLHQILLQQKLITEALPAQYFQMLCRNFGFPAAFPFNPLLFQSTLMGQQGADDLRNFLPTPQMSGGSLLMNPFASPTSLDSGSSMKSEPKNAADRAAMSPPLNSEPQAQSVTSTPLKPSAAPSPGPGPVKMVIKNGVLMQKQKQRRYRTERPFACEHCSARFTLRSNMERHIKQQHPQYWAQRQKGGHHLMRRGSGSAMHPMIPQNISTPNFSANAFSGISEQVKYAILAQQLKQNRDAPSMILHNALSNGTNVPSNNNNDDDEPKLVIDEEDDADEEMHDERQKPPKYDLDSHEIIRKITQDCIDQSNRMLPVLQKENTKELESRLATSFIPKNPVLKEANKEEDLASISKLVGNTNFSLESFFNRPTESSVADQSDEEGLVASGSASESNNSGTDDPNPSTQIESKKKSAYSMAPNRVACPYCQRMFPWSSSLRRHILTHTGQKPFKCSHCPLLFTTKSNCDRHLLRKHGDVESAMSVPVPIEEMPEPKKERVVPISSNSTTTAVAGATTIPATATTNATVTNTSTTTVPTAATAIDAVAKQSFSIPQILQAANTLAAAAAAAAASNQGASTLSATALVNNSDLPFKCHLCDSSFGDRTACLDHMKAHHGQEFNLIMGKVNLESESDVHTASPDDEEGVDAKGGKYPDYTNRKVICAFCMRRFWSTEDLRRHVRTHSGERPFQCNVCLRRFTLKHSMLRHRKKHANKEQLSNNSTGNSASDISDDESSSVPSHNVSAAKMPDLISKEALWKMVLAKKCTEPREEGHPAKQDGHEEGSDIIGNLLGISDPRILNKLLSSADEAAKLLGVKSNNSE